MVQRRPDQPGKTGNILVRRHHILVEHELLDRIQAIEDKMRVHLRLERNMLQFSHPPALRCFLFLLAAGPPDPPACKQPGSGKKDDQQNSKKPGPLPKWSIDDKWKNQ